MVVFPLMDSDVEGIVFPSQVTAKDRGLFGATRLNERSDTDPQFTVKLAVIVSPVISCE